MPIDRALGFRVCKLTGLCAAAIGTGFSVSLCGIGLGIYLVSFMLELATESRQLEAFPGRGVMLVLLMSLGVSLFLSDRLWLSARGYWKYLEGFALFYAC